MPDRQLDIVRCPVAQTAQAAALVLCDVAPALRREIAPELLDKKGPAKSANEALYVALRDGAICGVAWGQRQPGNTAILWPPRLTPDEEPPAAERLVDAVVGALDAAGIGMIQVLLPEGNTSAVPALRPAGFRHLADLLYLTCEAASFPAAVPAVEGLEFAPYDASQRGRLMALVERTYEGTQDCVALGAGRPMDDVIDGYQATGRFCPSNWLFVRAEGQDAGVLLLTDHPAAGHWELVYMGLVPQFRGRGWGVHIAHHAQWLARCAHAERIVLAVDAHNGPALAMYRDAGFVAWDRRAVWVRFAESLEA